MSFGIDARRDMLRGLASDYARVSLTNIVREYPVLPLFVAGGPGPYQTHREMHPAFFGCFDWHSCVELHWVIVHLLKRYPDEIDAAAARHTLGDLLTPANIAAEVRFFADPNHRSIERPYGWGWLLTLQHELATWDDPDGSSWAEAVAPLAGHFVENLLGWLPKLTYPVRTGVHPNTAFALSRSFDYATLLADRGDNRLLDAIHVHSRRWFARDTDYPARYEPSGSDFLSAGLCEAELMSLLLEPAELSEWLSAFLPGLAREEPWCLFIPAEVSDPTDGHIAHLHGLNLSRAWAMTRIAERLPEGDPRSAFMLKAAERHALASLPHVTGSDYMV
ncbi:MAG: DUF2891 domain-containing protein, partial [Chloroflexota bacterium]|nr:DUF2891 domain-containing protein [Chloroflexota bacterium]